ncbi:MAG: hypothetical protein J2P43_03670 [Candidatus Dormibacteraeota bacterium]|nr:hypothetical protein [Candidatus Dormibacteraeota bacterium]
MAVGEQKAKVGADKEALLTPPAVLHAPHLLDAFNRSPAPPTMITQRRGPSSLEPQLDRGRLIQQS